MELRPDSTTLETLSRQQGGRNMTEIREELTIANADIRSLSPNLRKLRQELDKAKAQAAGIETQLLEAAGSERELQLIDQKIEELERDIVDGQIHLSHAREFVEGFTAGFDLWTEFVKNVASGWNAVKAGGTELVAQRVILEFMPASLDRLREKLEDLKASRAAKAKALGK